MSSLPTMLGTALLFLGAFLVVGSTASAGAEVTCWTASRGSTLDFNAYDSSLGSGASFYRDDASIVLG